ARDREVTLAARKRGLMAIALPPQAAAHKPKALAARYRRVRNASLVLAEPLAPEDQVVQTIPEVSPTMWHLAHVTWFFERFCLLAPAAGYEPADERYFYLFNSYYYTVGEMYRRPAQQAAGRPPIHLADRVDEA